jgi:hypothetical protein
MYPIELNSARLFRREKPLISSAPLGHGICENGLTADFFAPYWSIIGAKCCPEQSSSAYPHLIRQTLVGCAVDKNILIRRKPSCAP